MFFFLGSDLFDPKDLSREEIGLTRTDHLKKNVYTPVSLSARARLTATFVYSSLLHRRRCISDIWYGQISRSCTWRRRDEEVRKTFTFLWIIFQLSTFIYRCVCVKWVTLKPVFQQKYFARGGTQSFPEYTPLIPTRCAYILRRTPV